LIKLSISYTNVIKLKYLLLPKIILYYNIYKLFLMDFMVKKISYIIQIYKVYDVN
jgi:hypothetical protein